MARRKSPNRASGNSNVPRKPKWGRGEYYTAGELFMAGCGALILVLFVGIIITSLIGD